jgi:hypothetical protein
MINAKKLHKKFQEFYPNEYKGADLQKVCDFIVSKINPTNKKNSIGYCLKHYVDVCNFLIQWEGTNKN